MDDLKALQHKYRKLATVQREVHDLIHRCRSDQYNMLEFVKALEEKAARIKAWSTDAYERLITCDDKGLESICEAYRAVEEMTDYDPDLQEKYDELSARHKKQHEALAETIGLNHKLVDSIGKWETYLRWAFEHLSLPIEKEDQVNVDEIRKMIGLAQE